jgi:hypothetical protein
MNPAAMPLLEEHPENINWSFLSGNPGAIDLVEALLYDKSTGGRADTNGGPEPTPSRQLSRRRQKTNR